MELIRSARHAHRLLSHGALASNGREDRDTSAPADSDRERQCNQILRSILGLELLTQVNSTTADSARAYSADVNSSRFSRQCALCREGLCQPACTPCGHVYCWSCLLQLFAQSRTRTNTEILELRGNMSLRVQCPECRHHFSPKQIRAIHATLG